MSRGKGPYGVSDWVLWWLAMVTLFVGWMLVSGVAGLVLRGPIRGGVGASGCAVVERLE